MTTKFYFIILFILCFATSCKKENTFKEYEFADKPAVLECNNLNSKLYNEALYSFENDILNFYGKDKKSYLDFFIDESTQKLELKSDDSENYLKGVIALNSKLENDFLGQEQ